MYYIYSIINKLNGNRYIGITVDPARRFSEHMTRSLRGSKYCCPILASAVRKYGRSSFSLNILFESEDKEEAYDAEVLYIKLLNTYSRGYNASPGGEGTDRLEPWNKGSKGVCKGSPTSFKKGQNVGEKHPRSKLTDEERLEVYNRYLNGEKPKDMEKDYSVHWSNLYRAIKFIERQSMGQD